jgi:hypothetical protein
MRRVSFVALAACIAPMLVFAAVYVPAAGHGLIQDDYSWILRSRVRSGADVLALFHSDNGFYRPVVSVTFAINEWMFGAHPYGYGLTNVLLALACAWAIGSLARALGLARGAAVLASAIWLLNFHGVRMAVLWISGRTALVLTLTAVLAATAFVRGRLGAALACLALALFAKEEAVLLPAILLVWSWILTSRRDTGSRDVQLSPLRPGVWLIAAGAVTGVYFAARSLTHAMTPLSAPPFYTPTFDPAVLGSNLVSYADRALTWPIVVCVLAALVLGRPRFDRLARRTILCGVVWLAGGFALTMFLPVRSDLYACFPSAGASLAAAALCAESWEVASEARQRRALVAAIVVSVAAGALHYVRTDRWVSLADFASASIADLERETRQLAGNSTVVIRDDRAGRVNLGAAFGTLMNDAYTLVTGRTMKLWIEPPPLNADLAGLSPPCATCVDLRLAVADGRIERARQ